MADVDWGSEDNQAKPKKRVPTWLWIGGGCCGVAVIGAIALVLGGVFLGRKAMDQDANWKELAQVLPYDDGAKLGRTIVSIPFQPGVEHVWQIQEAGAYWQATFRVYSAKRADDLRKNLFEERDTNTYRELGALKVVNLEVGKLEVQGRQLDVARFLTHEPDERAEADEAEHKDPEKVNPFEAAKDAFRMAIAVVDVTPVGTKELVLLQVNRLGSNHPAPDETLVKFLESFHIGQQH